MNSNSLSVAEFERLKSVVEKGLNDIENTWLEVSDAMRRIRDSREWKKTHKTWNDFVEDTWHISKRAANQRIKSGIVAKQLAEQVGTMVPTPRAARALAEVPEEQRVEVAKEAGKKGPLTSASVDEAARKVQMSAYVNDSQKPVAGETNVEFGGSEVELDAVGIPIPAEAMPCWQRSQEVQDVLTVLSRVKGVLTKAEESKDPQFAELHIGRCKNDLENAYLQIKRAKPFAVCPVCQGKLASKCTLCSGRGMISEFMWNRAVDKNTRELRAKIVAKHAIAGNAL